MASAPAFNLEAQVLVSQSVGQTNNPDVSLQHVSGVTDGDIGRLAPGQKAWQLRTPIGSTDPETIATVVYEVVDVEVVVLRCLHLGEFPDDENFYRQDEMLANMSNLMKRETWRDLSTVKSVGEGPLLSSAPERDGNVISYTVSLSVSLNV